MTLMVYINDINDKKYLFRRVHVNLLQSLTICVSHLLRKQRNYFAVPEKVSNFAMSLKILLVLKRSTKISEKSDMTKSWTTFCCPGTYKNS